VLLSSYTSCSPRLLLIWLVSVGFALIKNSDGGGGDEKMRIGLCAQFSIGRGYYVLLYLLTAAGGVCLIGQIYHTNTSSAREKVSTVPNAALRNEQWPLEFTFGRLGDNFFMCRKPKND
jgi:hypothetical protein